MDDNPSKLCLKDFIPVDFTPEDGINAFISYHDRYNIDDRQVVILPDLAYTKDEELSYIEEFSISFVKLANRNGVNVCIPDVPVLAFYSDININLPTFICDSVETADRVVENVRPNVKFLRLKNKTVSEGNVELILEYKPGNDKELDKVLTEDPSVRKYAVMNYDRETRI